jgi:hypothetical protein
MEKVVHQFQIYHFAKLWDFLTSGRLGCVFLSWSHLEIMENNWINGKGINGLGPLLQCTPGLDRPMAHLAKFFSSASKLEANCATSVTVPAGSRCMRPPPAPTVSGRRGFSTPLTISPSGDFAEKQRLSPSPPRFPLAPHHALLHTSLTVRLTSRHRRHPASNPVLVPRVVTKQEPIFEPPSIVGRPQSTDAPSALSIVKSSLVLAASNHDLP